MAATLDKYMPFVIGLFNTLLSFLASSNTLPVEPVAKLNTQYTVLAIISAALGTILGHKSFRRVWIAMVIVAILAVPTFLYYSKLLAYAGLKDYEFYLAGFLYFYIYFTIFYMLTHLERLIVKLLSSKTLPITGP